ncbi:MAG: glycosyltransferase family 4 protein [Actinomycetota bacterium]|nr:glycosyltransferase family 4 protein [Actinomycetota bacterium]
MRVCLVYDCLFPHTVGGAERWYRSLAERLAADGHDVTYLTLRQWDRGVDPGVAGVNIRIVGPRMGLYTETGRRRVWPPLVFGLGVLLHLLRYGRRYEVVHTCSFPYFSLLAAAFTRRRSRYRLVVDWFEVWTRRYWRDYLGRAAGDLGWLVQRICVRVPQRAFCFSHLYAARLREEGLRDEVTVLAGAYDGPLTARPVDHPRPVVVFAGRHIPEKQVPAIVPAIARVRASLPDVSACILGDGPEREKVLALVASLDLEEVIQVPGFVATETVDEVIGEALCMLLPSRREGYGLVVIEAAARGTPSIVVADPDNAATELIDDDVNGVVAASASSEDLADAILRVHEAGPSLRRTTVEWFTANAPRLSLRSSLDAVARSYRG